MAAGLGFKTFTTGEVLTAADTNGYLMQGVLVFASAAARDAAITSPQEGQFAYLKDTNVTTYYTGAAWANLDTTGMTNPMTTTGDTIYSSSGSTPARLGIGTAGQVLTVNSGATAPEWAAPSAGGAFVGWSIKKSGGQTITNNTATAITLDQENFDTDSFHSTSTNTSRVTIPSGKSGYYQINIGLEYDATATGVQQVRLYKNGVSQATATQQGSATVGAQPRLSIIIDAVATDYFEIYAFQTSGGNLDCYPTASIAPFNGYFLGA